MTHSEEKILFREDAVTENKWQILRRHTDARIGIGRAGPSQTTRDLLAFQLAHARAQDAVNTPVDWEEIEETVKTIKLPFLHLHSQATKRSEYLQRPDLGRRLDKKSKQQLTTWKKTHQKKVELCLVIADGLSATAIETQASKMLKQLTFDLQRSGIECPLVCLVDQARVAIGDDIAGVLDAELIVVLIGERPGLSSPNSLGMYFSYQAKAGFTDEKRNCLSNIRPEGLSFAEAGQRLIWLMTEAKQKKISGVVLKDESQTDTQIIAQTKQNFLITGKMP